MTLLSVPLSRMRESRACSPAQKRAVTGPLDRVTVAVLPSLTDQVSRAM